MAQYNPIKVKKLLELCCWLNKVEPISQGFEVLVRKINETKNDKAVVNLKYLQNLWSELGRAIGAETTIVKREDFLLELANLCSYTTWEEYIEDYEKINSFLIPIADLSGFKELEIIVVTDEIGADSVRHLFSFYGKIINCNSRLLVSEPDNNISITSLLEQNAYVISFFKHNEKAALFKELDRNGFLELRSTNRFVPVWSGNPNSYFNIPPLKKDETIIGERGLFLSLLIMNYLKDKNQEDYSDSPSNKSGRSINVENNHGYIISGGNLDQSGAQINIGGTNSTHYHNDKD